MANRSAFPATTELARARTFHAIDLDCMLGGSGASGNDIAGFFHLWTAHTVKIRPGDNVVVAASKYLATRAWFALPAQGLQRVVNYGKGGAAEALLDAIDIDHISHRFSRLVIGSGNGVFLGLASDASLRGLTVEQVTGWGGASRSLVTGCSTSARIPFAQSCGHGLALAA